MSTKLIIVKNDLKRDFNKIIEDKYEELDILMTNKLNNIKENDNKTSIFNYKINNNFDTLVEDKMVNSYKIILEKIDD
jgi:hypothetical protein